MYTESQLNSMNKGQVVNAALNAISKLEALSKGPLTADMVKAEVLNLKQRATELQHARASAQEAHILAIADLNNAHQKEITALKLKYESQDGLEGKEIDDLYKALEDRAKKAEDDLTFGLEKAENEANIKLAEIKKRVDEAEEKATEAITKSAEKVKKNNELFLDQLDDMETKHQRNVEQKTYEQKKALRDMDMKFVEEAAKEADLVVYEKEYVDGLKDEAAEAIKDTQGKIDKAVKEATSKVYATEGAKFNKLKNESENKIALLENDNKHYQATLTATEKRVMDLESKLALVPSQIKEAVEAAKAAVTVNQDAAKK